MPIHPFRPFSVMPSSSILTVQIMLAYLMFASASETAGQPSRGAMTKGDLAITNVSVLPMASPAVLGDMTVIIRDGRITTLGPALSVKVPDGSILIDGRGKFLMPGLCDMHVHLFSDDNEEVKDAGPEELGVMLANGVTTIRLMIGTPEQLRIKKEIQAGRILGPQMWIASPQLTGKKDVNCRVITTAAEATAAVDECAKAGYDFIKLTIDITPEVYEAVVRAAVRNRIRIVGHVDPRVGVARALAAGQHIEHLDGYMESVLRDDCPVKVSVSDRGVFYAKNWESVDCIDDAKVEAIAKATAKAGIYSCPTLTLLEKAFAIGSTEGEIHARPDWSLQPPKHKALYVRAHERYWKNPPLETRRKRYVQVKNRLVKAISDAGGKIMAGSDAPEWLFGYGFTLHRELESLVTAGLTPYQALCAATRTPAEFLHAQKEWGTIEPGKRADLVLLSGNPLVDIRNTTKIEGVCVGGKWLNKSELPDLIKAAEVKLTGESTR